MNRADYRKLAELRLADANFLLRGRRYAAAYYLAGYAVECALKACIAKQFRAGHIPDRGSVDKLYVHNLRGLAQFANLEPTIAAASKSDRVFGAHWLTVQAWTEASRYELRRRAIEARDMVNGVADPDHGVLQWLKQHW